MLLTLNSHDFDKDSGRKKIIRLIHELVVKVNELERTIKNLEKKEQKDVISILKT